MKKTLIITTFLLFLSNFSFSQKKAGKSGIDDAIKKFTSTEFFQSFLEQKEMIEENAKAIQLEELSDKDEETLKRNYNTAILRYNKILTKIKEDMLNKEVRKYIAAHPDDYGLQLEAVLEKANKNYATTYQKKLAAIRPEDADKAGISPELLLKVFEGIGGAVSLIQTIQGDLKTANNEVLEKKLIKPYSFKKWEELKEE